MASHQRAMRTLLFMGWLSFYKWSHKESSGKSSSNSMFCWFCFCSSSSTKKTIKTFWEQPPWISFVSTSTTLCRTICKRWLSTTKLKIWLLSGKTLRFPFLTLFSSGWCSKNSRNTASKSTEISPSPNTWRKIRINFLINPSEQCFKWCLFIFCLNFLLIYIFILFICCKSIKPFIRCIHLIFFPFLLIPKIRHKSKGTIKYA